MQSVPYKTKSFQTMAIIPSEKPEGRFHFGPCRQRIISRRTGRTKETRQLNSGIGSLRKRTQRGKKGSGSGRANGPSSLRARPPMAGSSQPETGSASQDQQRSRRCDRFKARSAGKSRRTKFIVRPKPAVDVKRRREPRTTTLDGGRHIKCWRRPPVRLQRQAAQHSAFPDRIRR